MFSMLSAFSINSQTLHVGAGYPYGSLVEATDDAVPGDSIIVHEGTYPGGVFVGNLQGNKNDWIRIIAATGETVIFEGGTNAWQFTDAAYLEISGFIFQHQTGNGLNFDDGGSYETPAHHIIFDHCTFRDMNASGNNDLLKLSGIDSFIVRNCTFLNGATGGSGIDMVGCHDSRIYENHFENLGSNSIQAKGGTRNIWIERNTFINGGARAVNLGGSTGLQFFRPLDAPFESAELKVHANVFVGSEAPIAFVGTIHTEVINNTIYLPTKWVMRILQETVDTSRFPPCGYNTFRNNLIFIDDRVNVECNIGPNTAPETFTISNNLWFHSTQPGWAGPDLPVTDTDAIIQEDPLLTDPSSGDFHIAAESPAVGAGFEVTHPIQDYEFKPFAKDRSIGALEFAVLTSTSEADNGLSTHLFQLYPNPTTTEINILFSAAVDEFYFSLHALTGECVVNQQKIIGNQDRANIVLNSLRKGVYIVTIETASMKSSQLVLLE
jgi:hypothetical protein